MGGGETLPTDKVREEYNPLVGFRSRDDLSRRRETVADFLGQVHVLPKLFDILLPDGRGHPLASCSVSGHFRKAFVGGEDERLGAGARARGNGLAEEEEGVGEKEVSLSFYKGSRNCAPPHLPGKLAYSPSAVIDAAVGLPTPVLMRIP